MTQSTLRLLKLFFIGTVIALSVRLLLVENYRISSASMFPSLWTGDLILVGKSAFNIRLPFSTYEIVKFKRPGRSEVVAFTLPDHGIETFVKRVVAGEGDRVEIKEGKLFINNEAASYEAVRESDKVWREKIPNGGSYLIRFEENALEHYGPVDVPSGYFFAMGDNRLESVDSRVWGPVPYSCLKGRAQVVWLSSDDAGKFRFDRTFLTIN
jgi:signal peptidase I